MSEREWSALLVGFFLGSWLWALPVSVAWILGRLRDRRPVNLVINGEALAGVISGMVRDNTGGIAVAIRKAAQ